MIRALAALLVLALAAPAHALSVYTDRAAWETAVSGSIYTETFDLPAQAVPAEIGGTLYTPTFDIVVAPFGVANRYGDGRIGNGEFAGDLANEVGGGFTELAFHTPIAAFGLDVVRTEFARPLYFTVAGDRVFYQPPSTLPLGGPPVSISGFFGMVSDTPFSSVRIDAAGTGELFFALDNVSTVPEPGLGALVAISVLLATRRWWSV